jgi:hypothetical protein
VTFWEEVAAQAVGNFADINAIILPFGRGDGLGFDPSVGSEGA